MCSASWRLRPEGTRLWFNRDEQWQRPVAEPPMLGESKGRKWLAPRDPQAGGTWLVLNDAGLAFALLNAYPATHPRLPQGQRSRGLLVKELASMPDLACAKAHLQSVSLANYAPFTLLGLTRGQATIWQWNGQQLTHAIETTDRPQFLTSSSYAPRNVAQRRAQHFAGKTSCEALEALHRGEGAPGPATVCAQRADAGTVSLCVIEINDKKASLHYTPRGQHTGWGKTSRHHLDLK